MTFTQTEIDGVIIIEPEVHEDHRGFFLESYSQREFEKHGIELTFVQDNHSLSAEAGTLRGLHYQAEPMAQSKLVRVLAGSVFDVAVDLRAASQTYGKWVGVTLSAKNKRQLLIPQGFAHGFMTLEPHTEVAYKVDQYYSPACDRGIRYDDPDIAIAWPPLRPILSDKDSASPYLKDLHMNRKGNTAG